MTTERELFDEVSAVIERQIEAGEVVAATWLTHAIVEAHANIAGDDADWYRVCAYGHVRATVRRVLQQRKQNEQESASPQLVLPGYERLQHSYLVVRDGEQTIVPIGLCSREELELKLEELERMAAGCLTHARELRRYLSERDEREAGNC